jgi:hypothetical protein
MYFNENFRKSFYAYYIHICSMKSPLASTHNSLNLRQELLAGAGDDLHVHGGHYL